MENTWTFSGTCFLVWAVVLACGLLQCSEIFILDSIIIIIIIIILYNYIYIHILDWFNSDVAHAHDFLIFLQLCMEGANASL